MDNTTIDEEGQDIAGIELDVNLEKMGKEFADVESLLDYADRCCDDYCEDLEGDEVRAYDNGHNIDTLIDWCAERGYILDYKKVFEFTSYGNNDIYFRDCDLKVNFN